MESLRIKGFITAVSNQASFYDVKSSDTEGYKGGNPAFYQKLVDNDIEIAGHYYHVAAGNDHYDLDIEFPWFDGWLHIVDGIAYIISEEYDRYCSLSFHEPVRDAVHLTELLSVVYSIAYIGWRKGFESGEQRRARLIREAMNP